ncbi:hypothetical protein LP420_12425 [Massilia sp. B-10]|nr:hypothetical protein LP420_12425 [Massilia sp. B-10]
MLINSTIHSLLYLSLLFYTPVGNIFPDVVKVPSAIGLWVIGVAFLIAHITPEGEIKYKIWS